MKAMYTPADIVEQLKSICDNILNAFQLLHSIQNKASKVTRQDFKKAAVIKIDISDKYFKILYSAETESGKSVFRIC